MKELSVEEKAKRYDEAIEIARQIHDADRVSGIELTTCEEIFPELEESGDERIRKDLLGYLHTLPNHFSHNGSLVTEWVAWLEKQGEITKEWSEMKMNNIQTELQEMVDLKQKTEQGEQKPYASETYEEALAWLKKQRPSGCPEYCVMSNCSNCPYHPIIVKLNPADVSKQEPIDTTDLTDFEKCFKGMCCDKNQKFVKECCVLLLELARKQIQGEQKQEWSV